MKIKAIITTVFASAMLVGCAGFSGTTATGATPMGAASTATGASSKEPQSANSLPAGASVDAPITTNVGRIGTTHY